MKKFLFVGLFVFLGFGCNAQYDGISPDLVFETKETSTISAFPVTTTPQLEVPTINPENFFVLENQLISKESNTNNTVLVSDLKKIMDEKIPEIMKEHKKYVEKLRENAQKMEKDYNENPPEEGAMEIDWISMYNGLPKIEKFTALQDGSHIKIFFRVQIDQGLGDCGAYCYALLPLYATISSETPRNIEWKSIDYKYQPLPAQLFKVGRALSLSPNGRYVAVFIKTRSQLIEKYDLLEQNSDLVGELMYRFSTTTTETEADLHYSYIWDKNNNLSVIPRPIQ